VAGVAAADDVVACVVDDDVVARVVDDDVVDLGVDDVVAALDDEGVADDVVGGATVEALEVVDAADEGLTSVPVLLHVHMAGL